jgi:hypothetical protein
LSCELENEGESGSVEAGSTEAMKIGNGWEVCECKKGALAKASRTVAHEIRRDLERITI